MSAAPAGASRPFGARFVTPMLIGSALNPINSSLIATALVPLAHGIHVSVGQTAVLVSALYLASAVAQPSGGKLGEALGPKRVFLGGILLVLVGGAVGGLGQNLATLAVARVLIGVGTSAGYPSAMLIIRRRAIDAGLSEPPGRVLGALQIAGTATAALGLPLGGLLVQSFGWRWCFLIDVPLAVVAFVLTRVWLPADVRDGRRRGVREVLGRIDIIGILLFAASLSALLVFIENLSAPLWPVLGAAVVLAVVLVLFERRAATPFLDIRVLVRNAALTRSYLRYGLTSFCIYVVLYGVTDWLGAADHLSAGTVGLLTLPMSALSAFIIHPVAGRNLTRSALVVSAVASGIGSIGLLVVGTSASFGLIVGITLVFGVALGTFAPANQTALYRQSDAAVIGTSAGLMRTFGYVGSIASAALVGVVFHARVDDGGLHALAAAMIGVSAVGFVLAIADPAIRSRRAAIGGTRAG